MLLQPVFLFGVVMAFRFTCCTTAFVPSTRLRCSALTLESSLHAIDQGDIKKTNTQLSTRRKVFSAILGLGSSTLSSWAVADSNSIAPCKKDPGGAPANCVSTASVKQVDLYMAPWVWQEGTSAEEVVGRLKGAIEADASLSLTEQIENRYLRVKAARNFCYDEIEFLVNPADRVVTFRSQQVEGPDSVSDFGANRKRLDELRKRTRVLTAMGEEFSSADTGPREGAVGQLKAFWGLQSGGGYESILLDEDDY